MMLPPRPPSPPAGPPRGTYFSRRRASGQQLRECDPDRKRDPEALAPGVELQRPRAEVVGHLDIEGLDRRIAFGARFADCLEVYLHVAVRKAGEQIVRFVLQLRDRIL